MGIDLELFPIKYPQIKPWIASETLSLNRNYALFERIRDMNQKKVSVQFMNYEDSGLNKTKTDAYGGTLHYLKPADFKKIKAADFDKLELTQWNRAIIVLMQSLPKETPIVLYWC